MLCKICGKRKPRRYCPGVAGDICSICCGNEREVTISCPLDCPYLAEARTREKYPEVGPDAPNADIELSEGFVREHKDLFLYVGFILSGAGANSPAPVDADMREALDALTRTYRTLASGLYYDSRPVNPFASTIYSGVQDSIAEYRKDIKKEGGAVRDAEILAILVLFQRMALHYNNGRPKGRALIDFLRHQFDAGPAEPKPVSPIIAL